MAKMMPSKINIFEEAPLEKILQILNNESFGLGGLNALNVMRMYPFEQLPQIHGQHHGIIRLNAQIIEHFLPLDDFLNEEVKLEQTVQCLLSNLRFLLKQENSGDASLVLLDLFRKLLMRLAAISYKFTVSIDLISNIANCVMQSPHIKNSKIKECVCYLVIDVFKSRKYQCNDKVMFVQCVTALLLNIGDDLTLGFQIIIEMLENRHFIDCVKIESIYIFMELSIKEIKKSADDSTLHNFLKCLRLVWSSCSKLDYIKKFFGGVLKKLRLIKAATRKNNDAIRNCAIDILILVINHEFKHIALDSATLRNELALLAKHRDWNIAECDVVYIVHYLEYIYLHVHHEEIIMTRKLSKTLARNFPATPALNKSICFLFGAYAVHNGTNEIRKQEKKMLRYLDQEHRLQDVLALHQSQLLWILTRAWYGLKMKVLKVWLKLHQNTNDILVSVRTTKSLPLMLDILKNPRDASFHTRILEILHQSDDPNLRRLCLVSVMKPIPNFNFGTYLIDLKSPKGNEMELGAILAKQLLTTMLKIQNGDMMEYACSYSLDIILKFQDHDEVLAQYMESCVIQMFLGIAKADDERLADFGLNILRVVLELQNKKKLKPRKTIPTDLTELLRGSGKRLKNALTLLSTVINLQNEAPILSYRKPSFGVWHRLLFLKDTDCRKQVFRILVKIMREEKYLAPTFPNIMFVLSECNRRDADTVAFPKFLRIWLWIVKDSFFYNVPSNDIRRYLEKLNDSKDTVQTITYLLNKCPSMPTTSAFNRQFSS